MLNNTIIVCSIFRINIEILQELSKKKIKTRIKSYKWKFVVRIDLFLHHIDFTDIDDLLSVIFFLNVKTSSYFQFR